MEGRLSSCTPGGWSISVIVPAYNEAAGIRQVLAEADQTLAGLGGDYEIVVVDDGSRDGTAQVVREVAQDRPHLRLLCHATNRGYGAALRTGFEAARHELVAFTDADGQFDLSDLAPLISRAEQVPVAVGYRVARQDPWPRRFFSWGYNVLVRALLGTQVRDCDCALKVFRKEALTRLLPETAGFFVNTEMLTRARQLGYGVAEVGVRHRPRLRGSSKVSLGDIPRTLAVLLPFWWSQVLFPGTTTQAARDNERGQEAEPETASRVPGWLWGWVVVVIAALLFFSRLGCPLQEPEEPRYAEIARQMLHSSHYLVPTLNGLPYYDKPPLLYWLIASSYALFGVHDWSARLVSCGAAFLTVLVTYLWGRRLVGARAAFAGALMLCLSARFVYLGRLLTMNSLLCLCVVASLAAGHVALDRRRLRWGWWLSSALACGLGLLAKGPVALVLVAVPLLAYQILDDRTARSRCAAWSAYVAVALVLALPWYLSAALTDPQFTQYFFWKHHVVRFVAPFDHAKPVWFYLPNLFLGMLPWSVLAVPLLGFLGRRDVATAVQRPPALGVFVLAALWCLLFYSAAGSKRAGYILPAMPPWALALGYYLDTALTAAAKRRAALLPGGGRLLANRTTLLVLLAGLGGSVLAMASGILKPGAGAALVAVVTLGFAGTYYYGRSWRAEKSWGWCAAATFGLLLAAVHLALPSYARRFSLRGQIRPQVRLLADAQVPVVCYPRCWDSVAFYLRRDDVRTYTPERRHDLMAELAKQPQALLVVKAGRALEEVLRELPGSLQFVPCGREGPVRVGLVRHRPETLPHLLAQNALSVPRPR